MSQLRLTLRSLLKTPGFMLGAILTIAVAIGANTTLFSVFDTLVLNPVSFTNPSSLVAIWVVNTNLNFNAPAVSWPRYEWMTAHTRSFSSLANSSFETFTLTGNGDAEQLNALRVTASFLPTLGVTPALGRNFTREEDMPNGPRVCVLSHDLWQTRFGGRNTIVGENVLLNGEPWEVIGVLPPHFSNPFSQAQVLAPRVFEVSGLTKVQVENAAGYSQPIARLKPGVSLRQAEAELVALGRDYQAAFSTRLDANNITQPHDFVAALTGNLRPTFYTLLGAVAFVLLIACANVASLFLGRLTVRHKEIAIRQSLGATRRAIIFQFLGESLVFSIIAGTLGVLLALWGISAIQSTFSTQLPPNTVLTLNWRALVFTLGVTLACSLLVGFAPAWQASKGHVVEVLKEGSRGSTSGRGGRSRAVLIVVEVALSVVLLVGSALLLLSFLRLQRTPPGFNPHGLATAFVGLNPTRYPTNAQQAQFFDHVIERLRATPGVTAASASLGLPLGGNPQAPYGVAGRVVPPLPQRPIAFLAIVSDDYFRTMNIAIREGRGFTPDDREGAAAVCMLNQTLAKRLFPNESALGKVILRGPNADIKQEVVGVIADVKSNGLNSPVPDEIYYPMRQLGRPGMSIVAGTNGDPAALQSAIKAAVTSIDNDQPISTFTTLDANVAQSLGVQRIVASLTAIFAGLALALAALGLYSVVAYTVAQRTGEIGIRMALGAQPRQIVVRELGTGMRLVAIGVACGLVCAAAAARLIQTLLFDVTPLDPAVYGSVSAMFVGIAALACLIPSMRASRVDPLQALRAE